MIAFTIDLIQKNNILLSKKGSRHSLVHPLSDRSREVGLTVFIMRKAGVPFIGGLLFIAGYFQAQKQTKYITSRAGIDERPLPAKPMVLSVKAHPLFALGLSKPILSAQ